MKPTFNNANYYRNDNTEAESENIQEVYDWKNDKPTDVKAVHSKLLMTDAQGVHIPRLFAENYDLEKWHIKEDDKDIFTLRDGPKNSWYWEAWEVILNKAYMIDEHGNKWNLEQDGDLWARLYLDYKGDESEN